MSRVIAAVDDSATAAAVLAMASAVAEVLGAEVDAVNVGGGGATAAATAARAEVPFRIVAGEPLPALVALADEADVVSFVIGQRSRVRSEGTGPTALGVADAVVQPVVVVPPDTTPPERIRRVLVAMEGTPARARQLRRTLSLARPAADLEVVVVHVDDEASLPMFSDHAGYDTEAFAAEFLTRYAPGVTVTRLELRIGSPVEEILRACETEQPDVLAMGWPHHGRPGRGDVVRRVLERATTPLLLVATR
jgi:nucleotide-binding universal stress UspA family protein